MSKEEFEGVFKELTDVGRHRIDETTDKDTLERAAREFEDLAGYAGRKSKVVTPEQMSDGLTALFLSHC